MKEPLEVNQIVCERVVKCLKCKRTIFTTSDNKNHICGYSKCNNCKKYCDMREHFCFMTKKECKGGKCTGCTEEKECYSCKTRTDKYIFYDFESTQETGVHEVNWVDCEDFYGEKTHLRRSMNFVNLFLTKSMEGIPS